MIETIPTNISLLAASIFGGLAVILGAFGAHAFKKIMTDEQLKSYETGVKYQFYHALLLLFLGLFPQIELLRYASYCIMLGTCLFSFSIYGLCWSGAKNKKLRFLGPITPIGGLFLVTGWTLIAVYFLSHY